MNYQQYHKNRVSDLDKLATILPELLVNMDEIKVALGLEATAMLDLLEGFRKNLSELLNRDVHPAECDVYVKLITNMATAAAMRDITENLIDTMSVEDLFDVEKMVDMLIEKTCNNLGAIIHGFAKDDIKKYFGDAVHEMLSKFGGLQGPKFGGMFGEGS